MLKKKRKYVLKKKKRKKESKEREGMGEGGVYIFLMRRWKNYMCL